MKRYIIYLSGALILFATACADNQTSEPIAEELNPVDEKEAVVQVIEQYESGLNSGSREQTLSVFTTDAVLLAADQEPSIGINALKTMYDTILGMYSNFNISIDVQQVDLFNNGATAWSLNTGSGTLSESGEEVALHSKSLIVLRKGDDGKWKIYQYMFNNQAPIAGELE